MHTTTRQAVPASDAHAADEWTYEGYWDAVIGGDMDTAAALVAEYARAGSDERELQAALRVLESEARVAAGLSEPPASWRGFHARALEELVEAAESSDD